MGFLVASVFSLVSVVDGIADSRLIFYYVLTFGLIFLLISPIFAVYEKLVKKRLSSHYQIYLHHIFLLSLVVLVVSSYVLKLAWGSPRQDSFYSFPRILAFPLFLFVFLGLSRVSRKFWKNVIMTLIVILGLGWTAAAIFGRMDFESGISRASRESSNVLLLTIESLRYDHLGLTSGNKIKTPTLDRLANRGLFFHHYYVQAPYTTASLSTLATGCYPFRHGARRFGQKPKAGFFPFMAKLVDNGYVTRMDISFYPELFAQIGGFTRGLFERVSSVNYVVSNWLGNLSPGWFGSYTMNASTSFIETARLIKAIRINRKKKWFFWTHFSSNCHWPYKSPPQFTSLYSHPGERSKTIFSKKDIFELNAHPERITSRVREQLDSAYSAEVSCIDRQIGFIMDQLESLNLLENTVVIISSDHGESLGEDGLVGHGRSLKDNLIHVPLIIYSSNPKYGPGSREIDQLVEEVDLAPTILDLCGVEYDGRIFDGTSLLELLRHAEWEKRSAYSEFVLDEGDKFYASLRVDKFKLVWDSSENQFFLYELDRDPAETRDVSQDCPQVVEEMKRAMLRRAGITEYDNLRPEKTEKIEEDMEEKLKTLGYIR